MPRRAAMVTQADVARALRAAKQAGAEWRVEIDGAVIRLVQGEASPQSTEAEEEAPVAHKKNWRL
jgi:hypothetical protein